MDKAKKDDTGYAVVKAIVGSVPFVGAAASELLSLIVASPLEKRREKWMEDIGNRLLILEDSQKIDFQTLQNNPLFIDVVLCTTELAIRTSEDEKIKIFQNVLFNCAVEETIEKTEVIVFLNLIDLLTTLHLKLLVLFNDPIDWFKANNKIFPQNTLMGSSTIVLDAAYPELIGKRDLYNIIWNDLGRYGLVSTSSLQTITSGSGLGGSKTTNFGKKFLNFIKEKEI